MTPPGTLGKLVDEKLIPLACGLPEPILRSVENVRLLMGVTTLLDGRDVTATRLKDAVAATTTSSETDKSKIIEDSTTLSDDAISKAVSSSPAGRALIKKAQEKQERMMVVDSKFAKLVVVLDGFMEVLTDKSGIDYKDAIIHYQRITDKFMGENFSDQEDLVAQVGGGPGV